MFKISAVWSFEKYSTQIFRKLFYYHSWQASYWKFRANLHFRNILLSPLSYKNIKNEVINNIILNNSIT